MQKLSLKARKSCRGGMVSNNCLELLGKFSNCVHANLRRPYLETCNTKSTTLKRIVLKMNQGKFEENVHLWRSYACVAASLIFCYLWNVFTNNLRCDKEFSYHLFHVGGIIKIQTFNSQNYSTQIRSKT